MPQKLYAAYEAARIEPDDFRDRTEELRSANSLQIREILIAGGIARVEVGDYLQHERVISFRKEFCDLEWVEHVPRRHRGWEERRWSEPAQIPLRIFESAVKGLDAFFQSRNVRLKVWCTHGPPKGERRSNFGQAVIIYPCIIGLVDLERPIAKHDRETH